jgi:hypothetical protein
MAFLRHGYKTSAEELERGADLTRSTDFEGLAISSTDHHVLNILNGKSA